MHSYINNKGQELIVYKFYRLTFLLLPFRKKYKNQILLIDIAAVLLVLMATSNLHTSHSRTLMWIVLAGMTQVFNFNYVMGIGEMHVLNATKPQTAIWQAHLHVFLVAAYICLITYLFVNLFISI